MEVVDTLTGKIPEIDVTPEETLGAALFGFGLVAGAMRVVREERGWFGWIVPVALMLSGLSLLIDATWDRRNERIIDAEEHVREGLEGLDPFARAKVLKDVAAEQLEPLSGLLGSEE